MTDIDRKNLEKEMERIQNKKEYLEPLSDFPNIVEWCGHKVVSIEQLETLRRELNDIITDLYELTNGYISTDTLMSVEYENDYGVDKPFFGISGPETLGSWKHRLKVMMQLYQDNPEAVRIIQKKLDELYEIVKL